MDKRLPEEAVKNSIRGQREREAWEGGRNRGSRPMEAGERGLH